MDMGHRRLCLLRLLGTLLFLPRASAQVEPVIAYEVPSGTVGNQVFSGPLGMDFDVDVDISITRLGVFDSGSDGLQATITARLFDRETLEPLAALEFTPEDPGDLIGGSRFKDLSAELNITAGSRLTIAAEGYSELEGNGNQGFSPLGLLTNTGSCSITFLSGRYGYNPGQFPSERDFLQVVVNPYAAGTFIFKPAAQSELHGGIAYVVPFGTMGNQDWNGPLGMDFDVNVDIKVVRLGVFDSESDGLMAPITASLWDRDSETKLAELLFAPDDPADRDGGSLFKELDPPLSLAAGFRGAIVAVGYGASEKNGNLGFDGIHLLIDTGGCAISVLGVGRFGNFGDGFPMYLDSGPPNRYAAGTFEFEIVQQPPRQNFHRADVDQNGQYQIADAVQIFAYLFLEAVTRVEDCLDAADADDNGILQLSDGVKILGFIFLGTAPPPAPFGACGSDPTIEDSMDCRSFDGCS
jgi:hypothetical protein